MKEIRYPAAVTYYVVRDAKGKLVTHGVLGKAQVCSTGQPFLDTYTVQSEYLAAIATLGVDVKDATLLEKLEASASSAEAQSR